VDVLGPPAAASGGGGAACRAAGGAGTAVASGPGAAHRRGPGRRGGAARGLRQAGGGLGGGVCAGGGGGGRGGGGVPWRGGRQLGAEDAAGATPCLGPGAVGPQAAVLELPDLPRGQAQGEVPVPTSGSSITHLRLLGAAAARSRTTGARTVNTESCGVRRCRSEAGLNFGGRSKSSGAMKGMVPAQS